MICVESTARITSILEVIEDDRMMYAVDIEVIGMFIELFGVSRFDEEAIV